MFANLQTAYAKLTRARFELERRTAKIEATRNLFQQVIESMTEALFLMDHTGHLVQTNPAARTLLERSEAELVGRPFSEVSGTRELPATVSQLLERTPTGTLHNLEVAIQTRSGSARPISASCGLVRDKRGKIIGMLVLASDVTERKWAEEERNTRVYQQAVVAELGLRALASTDSSTLMDDAVVLVAQTLGVEYAKVLELLPDGKALLLRAGVGWKEGTMGHTTVGMQTDSQAGYTLLSDEPVIVEDLRQEARFTGSPLLHDHGVVSGISVIIRGQNRPFGVLGAYTTRRGTFTRDNVYFLQAVANVLATAIVRKRAEEEMYRRVEHLAALNKLAGIVATSLDLNAMLNAVLAILHSTMGYDVVGIFFWNGQEQRQVPKYIQGAAAEVLDTFLRATQSGGFWKQAVQLHTPVFLENMQDDPHVDSLIRRTDYHAGAILPLTRGSRLLGLLALVRGTPTIWQQDECSLLITVADQVAMAMEKARLWEELQQKEGLRGRLLEQVIHAQEEERKRVARELHDDVCQSLTGLIMALGAVQASLTQSAGRARRILDDTTLLANNTLAGVRRMIADLRPRVLDDLGLVPALHRLAHDLRERAGVAVNIDAAAVPDRLPPLVETVLFRIAQEALTNVRKHAHAQRTTITLIVDRGRVILLVNDDGVGFPGIEAGVPRDDTHALGTWNGECGCLGLIGMRERAALLGGTFLVQSTQGQGTTVHVELPLEAV